MQTLAENGADVAFTYQNAIESANAAVKSVEQMGRRAFAIQADSADPAAIARSVSEAVSALGGLDILANSAAIGHVGLIADINVDESQAVMDINVRAPVPIASEAISYLSTDGCIATIGSALGDRVPFLELPLMRCPRRRSRHSHAGYRVNLVWTESPSISFSLERSILIPIHQMVKALTSTEISHPLAHMLSPEK